VEKVANCRVDERALCALTHLTDRRVRCNLWQSRGLDGLRCTDTGVNCSPDPKFDFCFLCPGGAVELHPQSQFAPADMIIHLSLVLMRRKAVGGAAGKSRIAHKCDLLRACLIYTGGVVLCVFASAALCFVSGDEW
jgi:hypothetical protein